MRFLVSSPVRPALSLFAAAMRSRRGNFGIMSALLALPMLGMVGMSVDLTRGMLLRSDLQAAADAAVMDAVTFYSTPGNIHRGADGRPTPDELDRVSRVFKAELEHLGDRIANATVEPDVVTEGNVVRVRLVARAAFQTSFLKLLDLDKVDVAISSEGVSLEPSYTQVHIMIDNSPSMGLGADTAAISQMKSTVGCEFACHLENSQSDPFAVARRANIPMRIDQVKTAVKSLADFMQATPLVARQFQMNVYSLGVNNSTLPSISTGRRRVSDPGEFQAAVENVNLMALRTPDPASRIATFWTEALTQLNHTIGPSGDGRSLATTQQVLMIITDGVSNNTHFVTCTQPTYNVGGKMRCVEPLPPAACQVLKERGVKIAVLYTTYPSLSSNVDQTYLTTVRWFNRPIDDALKDCASPGLFRTVAMDGDTTLELRNLFTDAMNASAGAPLLVN